MKLYKISEEKENNSPLFSESIVNDVYYKGLIDNKDKIIWNVELNKSWKAFENNIYALDIFGFNKSVQTSGRWWFKCTITCKSKHADNIDSQNITLEYVEITVYLNVEDGRRQEPVITWRMTDPVDVALIKRDILLNKLNIKNIIFINEIKGAKVINGRQVIDAIRLTRIRLDKDKPAVSLLLYYFKRESNFILEYVIFDIEHDKMISCKSIGTFDTQNNVKIAFDNQIERAIANGYTTNKSVNYIPINANLSNWDFINNIPKTETDVIETPIEPESAPVEKEMPKAEPSKADMSKYLGEDVQITEEDLMNFAKGIKKEAQAYHDPEGFFSGNIPDYALRFLGTTSVDSSQIQSMFGRTNEAVTLVNQFNSSLLLNISFIFNFSKGGAYGVYLSELDRAIKTKALQKELESKGYIVRPNEKGMLFAYSKNPEGNEQETQKDIDLLYSQLQQKGGSAFGINMNSILNAAKQDAANIQSEDPNLWEWIAVVHLGATIVHEAIHAKGNNDEGPSEQAEQSFIAWALPKVNEMYQKNLMAQGKAELFVPLIVTDQTRHAKKQTWYKKAQSYFPLQMLNKPTGSDLIGRFPRDISKNYGETLGLGLILNKNMSLPIEKRLSKQFMTELPPDLNQEHDILELQLRKNTRGERRIPSNKHIEEVLSEDHNDTNSYKITEEILDDNRPKPILKTINNKIASNMQKTATVFGWYNNLAISDQSTIPGLGDRVMLWDDRDEDFSQEEDWIRSQPRYNPEYDIKGIYYRWIEPRFTPQLFDDMTRDLSNTSPAKRFAATVDYNDYSKIVFILKTAINKIKDKSIKSTRFLISGDLLPLFYKVLSNLDVCKVKHNYITKHNDDDLYSLWLYSKDVEDEVIEDIENKIQNKNLDDETYNMFLKPSLNLEDVKLKIVELCKRYNLSDFSVESVVGDNALMIYSPIGDSIFKIGELLAKQLKVSKVKFVPKQKIMYYLYNGVKIIFEQK